MDETVYSAETNELYLQFGGYDFDKKNIENISKIKFLVSKIFVSSFSEPRILLLSSIENISESLTKPLELKLRDLRGTKIKSRYFKFNGKILNWNNWRQFNSSENDNKKRKIVFDEFIKKTSFISPVINLRFKRIKEIYSNFSDKINENSQARFSPLDGYLLSEKITFSELKSLASEMGQIMSKGAKINLKEFSKLDQSNFMKDITSH